jgi:hypothetical protein
MCEGENVTLILAVGLAVEVAAIINAVRVIW